MNATLVRRPPAPADDSCPRCEAALANVQGLAACAGCGWTAAR